MIYGARSALNLVTAKHSNLSAEGKQRKDDHQSLTCSTGRRKRHRRNSSLREGDRHEAGQIRILRSDSI